MDTIIMKQTDLLKLAIEKAGGKKQLSEKTGLRLAFFYEWEKGVSIKFDVMVQILEAAGIGLAIVEKAKPEKIEVEVGFKKPTKYLDEIVSVLENDNDKELVSVCDCRLDSKGLLRRGKIKCTKPKSEHKF